MPLETSLSTGLIDMPALTPRDAWEIEQTAVPAIPIDRASPVMLRTLRVLQVVNGEHYAGAERVQDLLALSLPRFGVETGFACVKPGRFPHERAATAAPLWEIPMAFRCDLRPVAKLIRIIREGDFKILHSHNPRAALIAAVAAARTGIPLIHHVHGQTHVEVGGRWWHRANGWLERRILQRCAAVIAVSNSVGRYLIDAGADPDKIEIIPNGVPARATPPGQRELSHPPVIGFIALLRPRKGLESFLEAGARLIEAGQVCRLCVIGRFESAEYEREIHELAEKLGIAAHVEWRGFRKPIGPEFDTLDALAFPSVLAEGMPMVLLEALAAGVPIVATRVPGTTDVIDDGENGLLVEPQNPDELAAALDRVLRERTLRERLRSNGLRDHAARYSDTVMARRTAEIYRMVLDGSNE